jgi:hypothetical protein
LQADKDLYHTQMSEREAKFLQIAWEQYANSAAELQCAKLLSVKQLLQSKSAIEQLKKHVETRLMWLSWSEQAMLNEMHVRVLPSVAVGALSARAHMHAPLTVRYAVRICLGDSHREGCQYTHVRPSL